MNGKSGTDERSAVFGAMSAQQVFDADLARFDKAFRSAGAIYTLWLDDEGRDAEFIDEAKVHPDLMRAWRGFTEYGYANGLMS